MMRSTRACVSFENSTVFIFSSILKTMLCIQLSGNDVHAAHGDDGSREHGTFDHFRIGLVKYKAGSAKVQPEGCAASVADEVEAELAVSTFHAVVHLPFGHIGFTHDILEMIDQRLHV